jgi:hypothetical protein
MASCRLNSHCTEGYGGENCQIGKAVKNHIKQEDSSKYALYLVVNLFLNTVGIPMGTNCGLPLVYFSLYLRDCYVTAKYSG